MDPKQIQIIDTTLRDGEQAPGVAMSLEARQSLAHRLCHAGVDEIELGVPGMEESELRWVGRLVDQLPNVRICGWCRATCDDLRQAETAGLRAVHISLPISDIQIDTLRWSRPSLWKRLSETIRFARSRFSYVSLGAADASRASQARLIELAQKAEALEADRLRLADTVGCWLPSEARATFQLLHDRVPNLPLGIHAHNDLGLATANTLAAIEGGARFADVTINGLGERAGNAALEQLVTILHLKTNWHTRIAPQYMAQLSWDLQQAAGRPVAVDKPIVGRDVFTHESGIHVHALLRDRRSYEAYDAALVGRSRQLSIRIGKHSGRASVGHQLTTLGLDVDHVDQDALLHAIKQKATRLGRSLGNAELIALYNKLLLPAQQPAITHGK